LENLFNDDEEAKKTLQEAIKKAQGIFKKVGVWLNEIGGLGLMQFAYDLVPNNRPVSLVNLAWDKIGEWEA
jgi:hypothetical protein